MDSSRLTRRGFLAASASAALAAWSGNPPVSKEAAGSTAASSDKERWVVLVHGIRGSPASMSDLEKALKDESYQVYNWSYPSTDYTIQRSAKVLGDSVIEGITHTRGIGSVDIVAHSMGGLVARYYVEHLARNNPKVRKLIMIGTPNHGSPLGDMLCLYRAMKGTDTEYIPSSLMDAVNSNSEPLNRLQSMLRLIGNEQLVNLLTSNWGNTSAMQLNALRDGFIEGELNKIGLSPDVAYLAISGDKTWDLNETLSLQRRLSEMLRGANDGVVPVRSAGIDSLAGYGADDGQLVFQGADCLHGDLPHNREVIRAAIDFINKKAMQPQPVLNQTPRIAKSSGPYTVLSPNGGEVWKIGSTQTIMWSINESVDSPIKIQMMEGIPGGESRHITTYHTTRNATSYEWFIDPEMYKPGSDYWINVARAAGTGEDRSDGNFTLTDRIKSSKTTPIYTPPVHIEKTYSPNFSICSVDPEVEGSKAYNGKKN